MKRLLSLVVLMALLIVPATSAFAQDGTNPMCEGLTADDCALLTASDAAMMSTTSFAMSNWSASFNLNMPNEDGTVESVAMAISGPSGAVSIDPTADVMAHLVIDSIAISAPDEEPVEITNVEVIVDQAMVYVLYEGEWYGQTLEEADFDPSSLTDMTSMTSSDMLGMLGIDLTGVMATVRSDADMDGQSMAVFTTEINVGQLIVALLSSPMLGSLLGEELGGEAMTPEDLQMIGMFLTPMLAGTTLTAERWIGVDDSYIHKLAVDLVLALDLSMMEMGVIDGELHVAADMGSYNEPVVATAPESYKPMEELEESSGMGLEDLGSGLSGLGM